MNRRRALTSAAVIAAVGALTAVTIPAIAGTNQPAGSSIAGLTGVAPPAADVDVAPELLAALARDLDLSPDQARARIGREGWAGRTAATLRADLTDRYAGAWYDADADTLMVGVTDEAAADTVRAAGAEPELFTRSAAYLEGVKASLDTHADGAGWGGGADPGEARIAGWYVEPASNTVVVIGDAAAARELAVASGVWGDAVQVLETDEQPRLLNDLRGGEAYFINNASRCSIGFPVFGGFVTAGHCASAGITTTGFNGLAQGEFVAASFPGVGFGGPDDWGVVATNDDWIPRPVVTDFAGGELPVAGSQEAPVGSAVCKYGSTTGVSCGVVQATDATVIYPEGRVTGLTRTTACAEPGDSGGAWLAGDQAQGVTSGGSGDCTSGGITFFQPLNEVLELTGATLVTTANVGTAGLGSADTGSADTGNDDTGDPVRGRRSW